MLVTDLADDVQGDVERLRQLAVDVGWVVAGDRQDLVPVTLEQLDQLVLRDAGEHRRIGDLVAVEVEDRQDGAVTSGIDELVGVPAGSQRAGLGFTVADDAGDEQPGVVERRPVGVCQGIPELAALVDRPRHLRRHVAGDPAGKENWRNSWRIPVSSRRDVAVHLGPRALQPRVGHGSRPAVARAHDVDDVEIALADHAVDVGVDEVEARRRAPVAEEARLDMLGGQRLAQQRVVEEVDLSDRQVVGGPPPTVDCLEFVVGGGCRPCVLAIAQRRHAAPSSRDMRPGAEGAAARGPSATCAV